MRQTKDITISIQWRYCKFQTHNRHRLLTNLPAAYVIAHCGDFSEYETEKEVLYFLNWLIRLPYRHKIFITVSHDICLWDAIGLAISPANVHFFQIAAARSAIPSFSDWHTATMRTWYPTKWIYSSRMSHPPWYWTKPLARIGAMLHCVRKYIKSSLNITCLVMPMKVMALYQTWWYNICKRDSTWRPEEYNLICLPTTLRVS